MLNKKSTCAPRCDLVLFGFLSFAKARHSPAASSRSITGSYSALSPAPSSWYAECERSVQGIDKPPSLTVFPRTLAKSNNARS